MSKQLDEEKLEKVMQEILKQLDGLTIEESTNVLLNLDRSLRTSSIVQASRGQEFGYQTSLRPSRTG
tara:strand:- start:618 stop:818 length:201 start_codon:yes stop_codon:yes gene_type:complete